MKSLQTLLFIATIILSGCVSLPDAPEKEEKEKQIADVSYNFSGGKDMTKLFTLTARYVNASNQTVSETIKSLPWTKTIHTEIPFDAHFEVDFSPKSKITAQQTYHVGFDGSISHAIPSQKVTDTKATSRAGNSSTQDLVFKVDIPAGTDPGSVNLNIAPLKFNKHFAFTFTIDDSVTNTYSKIWNLIHRKWIDEREYFHMWEEKSTGSIPAYTLSMSDGCGNERRFGFSAAIWSNWGNNWNKTFTKDQKETTQNSPYISWEELLLLSDFGASMCYHNVDERIYDKTNAAQILTGLNDDYHKVYDKLGIRMKVLALPDGNINYETAGFQSDKVDFIRSTHEATYTQIRLKESGSLYKKKTYGGKTGSDVNLKMQELVSQAESDNPYWVGLTVHRPKEEYMEMLDKIYQTYGRAGSDRIWVASWDEVYEYVELREAASIRKTVSGQTATFTVTIPHQPDWLYPELSFLLSGVRQDCPVTPVSENITGLTHAYTSNQQLINIAFSPRALKLAEKYTAKYEFSQTQEDKDDALYFISMLTTELAAPFHFRVENPGNSPLTLKGITINNGETETYQQEVRIAWEGSGVPTHYRIGEDAQLSSASWLPYNSGTIAYNLSPGFGSKTVYLQTKNNTSTSEIRSATIAYRDISVSEEITHGALDAYLIKYNGYKATYNKEITK